MEFPAALRAAVERKAEQYRTAELQAAAYALSSRYRQESGAGRRLLTSDREALAYSYVRMPATFAAVADALGYALETFRGEISSLLDAGAGSGAASWAAAGLLPLERITCLEREEAMLRLGRELMREGAEPLRNARWIREDLLQSRQTGRGESSEEGIPEKADLVIASYVLNEMAPADRAGALIKLWKAAEKLLLIVEPGTPAAFAVLRDARSVLLGCGAHIAAPCPHEKPCRLDDGDWCHFTCRVQRSKLHKLLKGGDAPYEDEKYAYMAFVKEEPERVRARVLRHPYVEKGQIRLELCTAAANRTVVVRKRDGESFKAARKVKCGDGFDGAAI